MVVVGAVAEYRYEQNPLREFLAEKYETTNDPNDTVLASEVAGKYAEWARWRHVRSMSPQAL